jgi:hypothetical protein
MDPNPPPLAPQVRSSTDATKRSFLERKGLTGPEISAAFARMPAEAPTAPAPAAPAPAAAQPPAALAPGPGGVTSGGQLVTYQPQQLGQPLGAPGYGPPGQAMLPVQALQPEQQPIRWSQVRHGASPAPPPAQRC